MCAVVWFRSVVVRVVRGLLDSLVLFCAVRVSNRPSLRLQLSGPPKVRPCPRLVRLMVFVPALIATAVAAVAQQPARFEDVVRNLRNPDPKVRLSAVRLLRETGYAEAISPLAAVVNDQVDAIQLEAIDAELSFFLRRTPVDQEACRAGGRGADRGARTSRVRAGPARGVAQGGTRRARRRAVAGRGRREQEGPGRSDLHARRDWIGRSAEAVRGRRGRSC